MITGLRYFKATFVLIVLNVVCFFIASNIQDAYIIFGLDELFLKGFYWQPLSSMFMHGNLTHLVMNMVVLFQCGAILEHSHGWKFFSLLYMLGGVLTSLLTFVFLYLFELSHIVVGASGALSVLFGCIACKQKELRYGLIIVVLLMSFAPEIFGMSIAWYAHFIGFFIGFVFALMKKN